MAGTFEVTVDGILIENFITRRIDWSADEQLNTAIRWRWFDLVV